MISFKYIFVCCIIISHNFLQVRIKILRDFIQIHTLNQDINEFLFKYTHYIHISHNTTSFRPNTHTFLFSRQNSKFWLPLGIPTSPHNNSSNFIPTITKLSQATRNKIIQTLKQILYYYFTQFPSSTDRYYAISFRYIHYIDISHNFLLVRIAILRELIQTHILYYYFIQVQIVILRVFIQIHALYRCITQFPSSTDCDTTRFHSDTHTISIYHTISFQYGQRYYANQFKHTYYIIISYKYRQ
eukprot:TRINITY_DN2426_c0_g1_i11.p1 TRINITY_DN2426_c0_g1~~TRINITY_DN2426_c0_g1_i11.p1  ORF type:complete len:243 (-),score=-54.36 TRINITY_DN2426_c0_g1_i11:66-794(-)